jgi:hypothetical protein
MNLRKIFDGVADNAKTFELINRGYSPDVFSAGDWFETGSDEYWYFLECLPPLDYARGAFSMSEFSTGYLTNAFIERAGRFYCLTIERKGPADFSAAIRAFDALLADA